MSELKLKQSNALLQSLLDEFKTDPITEENSIQSIIASVQTLIKSRDNMQIEYENQKNQASELQRQLGTTFNDLQKCSKTEVPILQQKVVDLQTEFEAIYKEMNVTNSLVVPLKEIVTKSHDELRKCVVREKQILASLTSKDQIDITAAELAQKPNKSEFYDIRQAENDISVDANTQTGTAKTMKGDIHNIVSDVPLKDVTAEQLRDMNAFTLHAYAKKNNIFGAAKIRDLTELRDKIWEEKQGRVMSNPLTTVEAIGTWNRSVLEQMSVDVNGMYRNQPVGSYSDDVLRTRLVAEKKRRDLQELLAVYDPVTLLQIQRKTKRQLLKDIRKQEPNFNLNGINEDDVRFTLLWKAIEIAVRNINIP